MSLAKKMGDKHDAHIAEVYGLRQTRGSGNQYRDQTDARGHRMAEAVAFAMDGKSTRARSISIKLDDLEKVTEQAYGERPGLPIRFYGNDRLTEFVDWVVLREDDLLELLDRSRRLSELEG